MDDKGTKVLPKQHPPLQSNRVLPTEEVIDFDEHFEGGPEIKSPDVNYIEENQRSEQAPSGKEILTLN